MPYRLLADLLALGHLAFVLFVVFGGLLVLRYRWVAWIHLPAAAWGALVELAGWICPLTPWEVRMRAMAGLEGYEGGFVEHYLLPLLYPAALTRGVQVALGLGVLALNAAVYALVVIKRPTGNSPGP